MDNKALLAVIGVAGILVGAGIVTVMQDRQVETASTFGPDTDFDGAFAKFQPVQELGGYNDLTVTAQELNDTSTVVDDANVVSSFNVNTSDGERVRYAHGIDISGPMQSIDVEVTPQADTASAFDVVDVRLVNDDDDELALDSPESLVQQFEANNDDEVDATVSNIESGDYAFVLEIRGTNTSAVEADQDMYTIEMDADTDADSDEAEEYSVTIDNAAAP